LLTFTEWLETIDKNDPILEIPREFHSKHGSEWETCKITFPDNKIVIKDYPNLKVLYANHCDLEEVEIDCPSLEILSLTGNKLESIDLTNVPNLRNLTIGNNNLKELNIKHLKNLETLWCFKNKLRKLDVSGLEKLEDLNCSDNKWGRVVSTKTHGFYYCKDKENILKTIVIKRMSLLKLDGCSNIRILDIDLNDLEDLSFTSQLPKLEEISLNENKMKIFLEMKRTGECSAYHEDPEPTETIIFNSPYLTRVNISFSNIKSWENSYKTEAKEDDEGYTSGGEDKPTDWEQRNYERQQAKLQKDFEEGKHVHQGQTHLDLSGCDFISSITIDGDKNYPQSLQSINLGDNCLNEVIIRNLPNLKRLIISHNKVNNLVIENCPQLSEGGIYDYKSNDNERAVPIDGQVYDDEQDNPLKKEEERRRREEEKENEISAQIIRLIAQAEEALAKGDLTTTQELLTELKELAKQPNNLIQADQLNATIAGLASRLATATNQTTQSQSIPTKLIVGSLTVGLVIIGVMFWMINKWVL
jgi:Leucine-rich repeat (LRR) protein